MPIPVVPIPPEPAITMNGIALTRAQAWAVRVAIANFRMELTDPEILEPLCEIGPLYQARLAEVDLVMIGRMPLMYDPEELRGPSSLPLALFLTEQARARCQKNHDQTPERLAERGGLSPCEALAILEDRPWERAPLTRCFARLAAFTEGMP